MKTLDYTLQNLGTLDEPISIAGLYALSALDKAQLEQVKTTWSTLPADRRATAMQHLVDLVDDNFEVNFDAMFRSNLVQTSYTLFWSLLALCIMVAAVRRGLRTVWMVGAGLLGIVVVKLFLVDLASHGTVERIVSFVVVGLLMLVIGWFAPVPPRSADDDV